MGPSKRRSDRYHCASTGLGCRNRQLSEGPGVGFRRTPSLWNVAYNRWYFWDGRADTLWSQALKPMEDRNEMNGSRVQVAFLISTDPDLRLAYTENFITSGCPLLTPRCREMQDALAESMH
jgi:cytochrome c peroxidase